MIITTGTHTPLTFKYEYNNHNNHENTVNGVVSHANIPYTVKATSNPIPLATYTANYYDNGLPKNNTVLANQYYGNMGQYWRHNFDDVLQIRGSNYTLHNANGQQQLFTALGQSPSHPTQALLALTTAEAGFNGYKWVNYKTGQQKYFDNTGKLRTLINTTNDVVTLTYTGNQLTQIANNAGNSLTLQYTSLSTNSIYATTTTSHNYPSQITADNGQVVNVEWKHNFRGQTATFHLLTRITEATTGTATTARDFAYSDSRWPASLTDIYTVTNIAANTKKLYAHFEYDTQGRAIYSSLANGAEAVTVNYVDELTRTVTNALGKDATYSFELISGVKKLKRVVVVV